MSENSESSETGSDCGIGTIIWALSPALAMVAIIEVGVRIVVGPHAGALILVSLVVAFLLSLSWSVFVLSRITLSEGLKLVLCVPLAVGMLLINVCVGMIGCSALR